MLAGAVVAVAGVLIVTMAARGVRAGVEWRYVRATTWTPFVMFAWLGACYLVITVVLGHLAKRHEPVAVLSCLAAGLATQLMILRLARRPLSAWILTNNFYGTAKQYDFRDLLRRYTTIASRLPMHARANMPGKVLLFEVLRRFTTSAQTLGYLVVVLAGLGGVLLYVLTRQLFENHTIAVYAMALYFVVPSRNSFLASLNTITPIFALSLLVILLWYLRTGTLALLPLIGIAGYAAVFWEPSPLILGGVGLLLIVRHVVIGEQPRVRPVAMVVLPTVGFLVVHALMVAVFGFDVIGALGHVAQDAREFNEISRPGYAEWLLPNLREFAVNAGYAVAVLVAVVAFTTLGRLAASPRRWRTEMQDSAEVMAVALVVTTIALDLAGLNHGEVSRLWIFLAVLFLPVAAATCVQNLPRWSYMAVLAVTMLQTMLTVRLVGFDYADIFDTAVRVRMLHSWTFLVDASGLLLLAVALPIAGAIRWRRARNGAQNSA